MLIFLDDPHDSRLAPYRRLHRRGDAEGFIAEGHLVVERLLESDWPVHSLLIAEGQLDANGQPSDRLAALPESLPIYTLPKSQLSELVGYDFHRGVLAHGPVAPLFSVESFARRDKSVATDAAWADRLPVVGLALLGVSDPENHGSLLRSAAALGVNDIFIGPGTISPLTRRVIRVSMASVFFHRLYSMPDPLQALAALHARGVTTIATTLDTVAIPINALTQSLPSGPVVLLLGNEAEGLPREVQAAATLRVTLPMCGGTDSLNVSVAGAIFMHELTRHGVIHPGATASDGREPAPLDLPTANSKN